MGISFSMQTGLFEIGRYHKAPIHLHPAFFLSPPALSHGHSGACLACAAWRIWPVMEDHHSPGLMVRDAAQKRGSSP